MRWDHQMVELVWFNAERVRSTPQMAEAAWLSSMRRTLKDREDTSGIKVKDGSRLTVDLTPISTKKVKDASAMLDSKAIATLDKDFSQEELDVSTAQSIKEYSDLIHGSVSQWDAVTDSNYFHQDCADNAHHTWRAEVSTAFKYSASQTKSWESMDNARHVNQEWSLTLISLLVNLFSAQVIMSSWLMTVFAESAQSILSLLQMDTTVECHTVWTMKSSSQTAHAENAQNSPDQLITDSTAELSTALKMKYFKLTVHATHLVAHTTTSDSILMMPIATCAISSQDQTRKEMNVSLICAPIIKSKPEMDTAKFAHHTTQLNEMRMMMEMSNTSAWNKSAKVSWS
jgi:hypothetical protein